LILIKCEYKSAKQYYKFVSNILCVTRNLLTSPSTCLTSPLVTANAPPVFCPFQLRSVTDEQHVRIMWFTRPLPLSHFGDGSRTHISSVGCFTSWPGNECFVAFPIMLFLIDI